MEILIDNEITIIQPRKEILDWCKENLVFVNPEYVSKLKMHLYVGQTPKKLILFKTDGSNLIVPYGVLPKLKMFIREDDIVIEAFCYHRKYDYFWYTELRDYQEIAVEKLYEAGMGIIQSTAGSGKTHIGIALACKYQTKVLWITNKIDLLDQSYERALDFLIDEKLLGTISEGKVNIGEVFTFATVQTLCNINLSLYKNVWDVIIVDECHRVAVSDSITQFQKVLENLSAKHKFGLSATVDRADGLIGTTYSLIGDVVYVVPDEDVKDYVKRVTILPRITNLVLDFDVDSPYMNSDGTINFTKLTTIISKNTNRNANILEDLLENQDHFNLILSDRLEQLRYLQSITPNSVIVDGSMTSKKGKEQRRQAINDLREGKKHYLFATYKLAKEGFDIPRLDRLFLITPQKEKVTTTQAIGRIARTFEGKGEPICYDYIDRSRITINFYKKRLAIYKKLKCTILEN